MVVDTSALAAFILDEDDADCFETALIESPDTLISAAIFWRQPSS